MKQKLLNSLRLQLCTIVACLLCAFNGQAWGETVTYTVSSIKAVTTSGTAPSGSSASYSQTYGTKCQMTRGNSATLTLAGFNNLKITNITLSAHSNSSAGSGSFSYSIDGGTTFTDIIATNQFKHSSWYGSWSSAYVDVSKSVDITPTDGNLILKISATVNSLFCESYSITYENLGGSSPSISASNLTLEHEATSGSIAYSISNPVEGQALSATTSADWISNITVGSEAVTFTTTPNESSEDRSAEITLSYEGATDKVITVTQKHFEIDFATLPFNWAGGVKADLNSSTGIQTFGLGSDYAESHGAYRIKFDDDGDYIQVKTNERPGVVTIGVKMIGGNSDSSIKVQGSSDGTTFTDVESLTISGAQNGILTLSTSNDFAANVRYVRMLFVKGANVGVGPITISRYGSVEAPTFSPLGGTFYSEQTITLSCAAEDATIQYSFDNSTWNTYSEPLTISETTTVYAKAVVGQDESDVVSATYTIAEKKNVVFNITNKELAYGESYSVTRGSGKDVETDGFVTITSDIAKIASVSGLKITAEAVGTTTITLSVAEGATYKAGQTTFTITVTAPEAKTTAPTAGGGTALFDFSKEETENENEWGLPVTKTNQKTDALNYSNGTYTITVAAPDGYYWAPGSNNRYLLMGKEGAYLTLPAFELPVTQIDVEGTSGASGNVKQNIFVGETAVSTETTGAQNVTNEYQIATEYQTVGTIYTLKVTSAHNTQIKSITVHFAGSEVPTISYTLPSSGVGTYCNEYPLDLSATALPSDVKAYAVESQTETSVTLAEITSPVKGGTGFIIKATGETKTVNFTSVDCSTAPEGNKLIGTLAPTYVAANTVYGMKSGEFHPNNAGNIPANRAYLPAEEGTPVKALTLIFKDADGITETRTITDAQTIFDLTGRRLQNMQKGVNIVNGKKVLVK